MKVFFQKFAIFLSVLLLFAGCGATPQAEVSLSETVLVDVYDETEYDLNALYTPPSGKTAKWTLTSKFGKSETVTVTDGKLALSSVRPQVYDAVATVDDRLQYRGEIDFCNSDEEAVWNTVQEIEYTTLYRYSACHYHARKKPTPSARYQLSITDEAPKGMSGSYYKIQTLVVDTWFEFVLLPLHSAKFYEQLGSGYTLTFDYCFVANGDEETSRTNHFAFNGRSGVKRTSNKWYTERIELSTLLQNYTALTTHVIDETKAKATYTRMLMGMAHKSNTDYVTLYIGNFRLERATYED